MKTLLIVRAVPDTGKTTFCNHYVGANYTCSADDFFEEIAHNSGKTYSEVFNPAMLGLAHRQCKEKCEALMVLNSSQIAISNTNCNEKDMQHYFDLAGQYGYTVFCIVLEKRHNGQSNEHNVPQETKDSMEQKLRNSLKLQ